MDPDLKGSCSSCGNATASRRTTSLQVRKRKMKMGREKMMKLGPIADERSRKTTFQRRIKGLKKKAYEFSTLCDVDACLIIYEPNKQGEPPEIWPENRGDVLNIIRKFRKQRSAELGRGKRQHVGLADFLEDDIKKLHCELAKWRQRNNSNNNNNNNNNNNKAAGAMYPTWDERINNFSGDQLNTLFATLKSKLQLLKRRIDFAEADNYLVDDGEVTGLIIEDSVDLTEAEKYLLLDDNDVTGLIEEYSVPPLNQNPLPPPPYTNSSSSYYYYMHHHPQPLSYFRPLDNLHRLSSIDPSLVFQTATVIGNMDYTAGNPYGASSSTPYHQPAGAVGAPMSYPNYYNPMLLNKAGGGGGGTLPYYFQPPMTHYSYFAPQLHQINEGFSDH